jgi:hypothetical protein
MINTVTRKFNGVFVRFSLIKGNDFVKRDTLFYDRQEGLPIKSDGNWRTSAAVEEHLELQRNGYR